MLSGFCITRISGTFILQIVHILLMRTIHMGHLACYYNWENVPTQALNLFTSVKVLLGMPLPPPPKWTYVTTHAKTNHKLAKKIFLLGSDSKSTVSQAPR